MLAMQKKQQSESGRMLIVIFVFYSKWLIWFEVRIRCWRQRFGASLLQPWMHRRYRQVFPNQSMAQGGRSSIGGPKKRSDIFISVGTARL